MKEIWRLARAIRGKGAPVFDPVFPYELGVKKTVNGKEKNIKVVPHRRQKVKIGSYVILNEPSEWVEIGRNIYATKFEVPDVKKLQILLYDKEVIERNYAMKDKNVKALAYGLCGYIAKIVKEHNKKIPDSCFDRYWWNAMLDELGIKYITPIMSWTYTDFAKIYKLLKEKFGDV